MPVRNEAPHLRATVEALLEALAETDFVAELVVVDDGSTDGSGAVAHAAAEGRLPCRVVSLPPSGRFKARQAGVKAATAEWILLLDARARLYPGALAFVENRLDPSASIWNGHVTPVIDGNPFGAFGNVLVHLGWAAYFDNPRETSFGLEDFDHFPKGTTCFLAPRVLVLEAMEAFRPRISDWRLVSDDTQLIRWMAARHRIQLAPGFGCDYQPRQSMRAFFRNAVYRGSTFLDGHGRRESRFFPVAVGFFPVSVALAALVLRRPGTLTPLVAATVVTAAAVGRRAHRPAFETASFAALTPIYAVGHAAGMWRGLALLVRQRLR